MVAMTLSSTTDFSNFESIFEKISSFFATHNNLSEDLVVAREDYFQLTGKLNQSDLSFNNRMNAFLLWFSFDWRSSETLKTPFEIYCEEMSLNGQLVDIDKTAALEKHVHSLFEFIKMRKEVATVQNLFNREKFYVFEPNFLYGSETGIVFETRLFRLNGKYRFSNYFIQHPTAVKKPIKKRCRQIGKRKESTKPFLFALHSYHTKWERYRNININSIYHFDKSLPEAK